MGAFDGERKTWFKQVVGDYGETPATLSLTADNDTVCGGGYAYGGTYSVAPVGTWPTASDTHDCSNIAASPDPEPRRYQGALAVTKAVAGTVAKNTAGGPQYGRFEGPPDPTLYNWFPDLKIGGFTG